MRRWRARWRGCSPTSCTCAGASRYGDGPFRAFTWSARAPDAAVDAHGVDAVRDLVRTRAGRGFPHGWGLVRASLGPHARGTRGASDFQRKRKVRSARTRGARSSCRMLPGHASRLVRTRGARHVAAWFHPVAMTWSARARDAAVDAHGVDAVRDLVRTRGTRAPRPETRGGSRTWSARGMRGEKPPHRPPGCPPGRGIPGGPRKNGQENIFPFAGVWCRIMSIRYPMESAPCRNGS